MADYGIELYDPSTGAVLFSINDSTLKERGTYSITTNGNTDVSSTPVNANSIVMVQNVALPETKPIVVLDIPNQRIVTSGGSGFNVNARIVDIQ